jgi:predicted aspartyl protease
MHAIASNHFKIISKINGVRGDFVLDTGASSTFVDLNLESKFKLKSETSLIKASGAGPNKLTTLISKDNSIKIRFC